MATFTEPFTTSLTLTSTLVFGSDTGLAMSGTTQGTMTGTGENRVRFEHATGSPDMMSQITWVSGAGDADRSVAVITRYAAAADTCYVFEVNDNQNRWQLMCYVAGTPTSLSGGTVARAIATPVTIRLESQGTLHRCYIDNIQVGAYTDSTITTGDRGGIHCWAPNSLPVLDNFVTGSFPTERAAPDAILAQTGLTGAVAAIQDDPDSPDGSWLTA